MSTYKMTPAERRARAQAIVKARENRSIYLQYQEAIKAQQEAVKEQQEKERLESLWAENDKNSKSWFVRGLSTIGDIAANVITGAVKGLEGIYDLGAGIVGAVGGIFSDDFQDDVQKHIAYDWTSENIGDPMQEWFKYSYTKDGGIIEGVASGVGQMLPAVAITIATGGAGAGSMVSTVGQIASLAYTGVSAAGNATESAYKDGASYYGGLGYGVASGAVEVATEKLFGGATKSVFGKGMLDDVGKSIADTGIKRVAKNAIEEGLEEVVAEVANPALKAIYKGKDAFSEYGDGEYWKGVGKAGAIGSLTALAYSGTVGYGLAKRGKGYVGSEADINDSLHEIEGQKKKANNLFADDRLSDENAARITQNLQGNYQNIEKTLKKATPEKRANLIKKFSLESAFEADGTIKADFASTLDFTKQAEAITENGANGSENAVASLDRRYINPDLIGQDTKVNETLAVATEGLRQAYMKEHNATHEQAVEAVKDITAFKGELSDKGKASYSKFKKGLNYLNGVSGHTVNMVVVDEHGSFNGNISDDTIYIGADTFENDSWAEVLVHEYTHFAEGTKEYAKLVHYLRENQELSAKAVKDVFGKGYGFTVEEIEKLYDKFEKGEKLTERELQTLTVYESELGAHLTENLLGNESFIDRLVGKETKLAEKVLNKIADLKKMFERIGNAEARAEYKQIKKAEKLYLGAVEKAGYAYINRKIVASRRREEIDASEEIQYNRKYFKFLHKNFPTEKESGSEAHRLAIWWTRQPDVQTGDRTLISMNDRWYLVERFDDADNNYQVEEYITKAEFEKVFKEIQEYGRSGKVKSVSGSVDFIDKLNKQGYSLEGRKSSSLGYATQFGREDNQIQRVDKKQVERGERTSNDGDGDSSGGGANKQGQPISFSLKESVEKDVLAYYGSTYRWAETGYIFKDGTRLDLSGRRDGASGGRRTVDHRDIFDVYEDINGGEAMIEFMSRGNIRVSPENPGINLQVEPTAEQYRLIQDMVERLGWKEEYFSVDFDDSNGDTVESLTYEGKVSARKVVADIKYYFKEGKLPYQSELSQFRFSLKIGGEKIGTEGRYSFDTDSEVILKDIASQNEVANFLPEGLSKEFVRAIRNHGNFAVPRLYRGMESDEFESIKQNGYIKSKGEYNFSNQQGETFFSRDVREAFSYATWFSPSGIREKFFEQGKPAYIVEVGNFGDLNFKYNTVKESSTKKEVDVKYITRILELRFNKSDDKVYVKDVSIDGMNSAKGELIHGEPIFVQDKTTGQILYAVQDEEGYETGKYISEREPGLIIDYSQLEGAKQYEIDYRTKVANISGKESDLIPYKFEGKDIRFSMKNSEGEALTEEQIEYFKNSKVVDEQGNLLVVYHGTMSGDFTVFDASKANVEGDMGAGFYFSSEYSDVGNNYENGGADFDNKIARRAERIEAEEDIDYDEAKERATAELSKGSKLFEVYLDMKNPAYVGGEYDSPTYLFVDLVDNSDIDIEDYAGDEDSYYEALYERQEEALQEVAEKVSEILEAEGISGYEDWVSILSENGAFEGGITISEMKELLNNNLYDVYDENGNLATNEVVRAIIEALGYDGIIDNSVFEKWGYKSGRYTYMDGLDDETRHYIVFRPNQIKLTTNKTPTVNEDIRYSLKDKYFYRLTDGQVKKAVANYTKFKVYSKVDAESIINNVLGNYMSFGESYGVISGKTKNEVIEMLWRGLNTAEPGRQAKVALDIAEYILQNAVLENIYEDDSNQVYIDTIQVLKPYLHSINLNGIKGDIKHKYDRDNSPYLLWGKRKEHGGKGADVIAMELEEQGFYIDGINEADIFFQIDTAYREAVAALKKQAKELLDSSLSKEERYELKQQIAKEVLRGFDYQGKPSKLADIAKTYSDKAKFWKDKYYDERKRNTVINRLLDSVQKIKDIKLGTFLNATQFKSEIFKGSIEKLSNIKYRGDLNKSGTRKIVAGLQEWYSKNNPMLEGVFDEEIASILEDIATGEGDLSTTELRALTNVVDYFKHFIETYNKVYRNGKYVDAQPIVEKYIGILQENKSVKVGWLPRVFDKVFNNANGS